MELLLTLESQPRHAFTYYAVYVWIVNFQIL